jgi:hypothetical protein
VGTEQGTPLAYIVRYDDGVKGWRTAFAARDTAHSLAAHKSKAAKGGRVDGVPVEVWESDDGETLSRRVATYVDGWPRQA